MAIEREDCTGKPWLSVQQISKFEWSEISTFLRAKIFQWIMAERMDDINRGVDSQIKSCVFLIFFDKTHLTFNDNNNKKRSLTLNWQALIYLAFLALWNWLILSEFLLNYKHPVIYHNNHLSYSACLWSKKEVYWLYRQHVRKWAEARYFQTLSRICSHYRLPFHLPMTPWYIWSQPYSPSLHHLLTIQRPLISIWLFFRKSPVGKFGEY